MRSITRWLLPGLLCLLACPVLAANYAAPKEADWVAPDFEFHTGETIALQIHYTTIGDPSNQPVLVLHGTGQSGTAMLNPAFAGALFGPGQALDATKYFIILPDAIGAGKSTKPSSSGLRAKFPHYNYDDMVMAQYRLITEGLHIRHLRLIIGNSMGGMQVWMWGEAHPDFMDALVPMASQPTSMAARNWMLRRILIESILQDPAYDNGNYTTQPPSLRLANVFMGIASIGGTLAYQALAPTRRQADELVDARLAAPPPADANDYIYQWDASRDYDAEPGLQRIEAEVLAINSADDERNPPETGVMVRAMKQVRHGRLLLIPASAETRGHGTTGMAKFYQRDLGVFLAAAPYRATPRQAGK